jgi:prophage regulatory protein
MSEQVRPSISILRLKQVKSRTGLSRSAIYLAMSKRKFPLTRALGPRAVGWVEHEIDQWLEGLTVRS